MKKILLALSAATLAVPLFTAGPVAAASSGLLAKRSGEMVVTPRMMEAINMIVAEHSRMMRMGRRMHR